ncbi:MAG: HD domain-containing protein [Coriobacteriaceae bacterium]|nr:HD domain-containing protein [Coriobacteriaceae bacterium]
MEYRDAHLNGSRPGEAALRVLAALEAAGGEAWLVGGWVRDALRAAPSHDIDMCSSLPWPEAARALAAAGIGVIESGTRFGGITAVADGVRIEVTTYRVDGFYGDGRHPDEVRFSTSVEDDLARRDFTVNAMAWHPARGLLDRYGGQADLAAGVIRAVGEPRLRFSEDALRILRAVRFACRLGFELEGATAAAAAALAHTLDAIARERVGAELGGILATGRGAFALRSCPEVIVAAIPELAAARGFDQRSPYHVHDVYEHTACVLEAVETADRAPSAALRWAALLHDVEKPATFTVDEEGRGHFFGHPERGERTARTIMRRLSLPDHLIRDTCLLIRYHDEPLQDTPASLLAQMRRFSGAGVDERALMDNLFDIKRADALGKAPACFSYVDEIERMRTRVHGLFDAGAAWNLKTLALNGRDLMRAGVEPGPRIGRLLDEALTAEISGAVPNERGALLAHLGLR